MDPFEYDTRRYTRIWVLSTPPRPREVIRRHLHPPRAQAWARRIHHVHYDIGNDVKLHAGAFLARPVAVGVPISQRRGTNGAVPAVQTIIKHEAIHKKLRLGWGSKSVPELIQRGLWVGKRGAAVWVM
jgi:hypothetical protein